MVHVLEHITQILMVCPVIYNLITHGSRPGTYYSNTHGLSCNLFNNIRKKCRGYRCESDMSLQMEMRLNYVKSIEKEISMFLTINTN